MSRTTKEQRDALEKWVRDDGRTGTHWDGCLLSHLGCAVLALLEDLEEAEERARKAEGLASDYARVANAYLVLVRCEFCEKPSNRGYVCIHCGWGE